MQATGEDRAKPTEGTTQVEAQGHIVELRLRLVPLNPGGPPPPVYARALDALDKVRMLRVHFEHIERGLDACLEDWITLPIESVPGPERLPWLHERTEPAAKLVYRAWDAIYGGLPGSRDPAARTRMRLIESLHEAVIQRDTWVVRAALARQALGLGTAGDEEILVQVDPEARRRGEGAARMDVHPVQLAEMAAWQPPTNEATAEAAQAIFIAQYPEYRDRARAANWVEALAAFEHPHGERSDGDGKWKVLARFATNVGCTPREAKNLRKDWYRWLEGSSYPTLFPVLAWDQAQLRHEERSSSQFDTPPGRRPEQT